MPEVVIIEPNITPEENEENLRRTLEIIQQIADELTQNANEG